MLNPAFTWGPHVGRQACIIKCEVRASSPGCWAMSRNSLCFLSRFLKLRKLELGMTLQVI